MTIIPACNAGDPGLGRSSGVGNGNPLQYSCLDNPMDRGAWRATVHGVTRLGHDLAVAAAGNWKQQSQTGRNKKYQICLLLMHDLLSPYYMPNTVHLN